MSERIEVAVGVIFNQARDKVLLSRRNANQHLAGYWEFPGGKIHLGENTDDALSRELVEELGITINGSQQLMQIKHDYHDKKVLLHVRQVLQWRGEPQGLEQQQIEWVPVNELGNYRLPEANQSILNYLKLPEVYLISRSHYSEVSTLITALSSCINNGLEIFQIRLADYSRSELEKLVQLIETIPMMNRASFILNGLPDDTDRYKVDGIHLKSEALFNYSTRPLDRNFILGASCHSEKEIEQALLIDADYLFISPVKETSSHQNTTVLGWDKFRELTALSHKPVYALGGMQHTDLELAKQQGAKGIAMIESVWNAPDPGAYVNAMLNA